MSVLFIRTLIFYLALILLMRLMGKRQIGELQTTEFVTAMMLSDIAVLPITDNEIPLLHGLVPLITLACLEIVNSYICSISPRIRRFIEGRPILLLGKGKISRANLKRTRLSLDELLTEIRVAGHTDVNNIDWVVFERSGKLSIFEKGAAISHAVAVEGVIMEDAMKAAGLTSTQIYEELSKKNIRLKDVLYMTIDDSGCVTIKTLSDAAE